MAKLTILADYGYVGKNEYELGVFVAELQRRGISVQATAIGPEIDLYRYVKDGKERYAYATAKQYSGDGWSETTAVFSKPIPHGDLAAALAAVARTK